MYPLACRQGVPTKGELTQWYITLKKVTFSDEEQKVCRLMTRPLPVSLDFHDGQGGGGASIPRSGRAHDANSVIKSARLCLHA